MNIQTRWAMLALLAVGCDAPEYAYEDDDLGAVEERMIANNGMVLNGMVLNGMVLNGMVLNGMVLNGMVLNGMVLNGMVLNGMVLNGTVFGAVQEGSNTPVSGQGLVGAVFIIERTSDNTTYELRIDAISPIPGMPDVNEYTLSARQPGVTTWESACKDGQGQAVTAIPIPDATWNEATGARIERPGAVVFACRNAALGKCVSWGYRPWAAASNRCKSDGSQCQTVDMRDAHQACTRMVRADFCGNGQTWTLNGTPLDIFDRFQTRIQDHVSDWGLEAAWTPNGAACVARYRQEGLGVPTCNGQAPAVCPGMAMHDYWSVDSITNSTWDTMPGLLYTAFPLDTTN